MAITDVYDFYRKMEDDKIILSFKGVFTSELLTSVLNILESKMIDLEVSPKKKKRVFNILVESFQNLYHHIDANSENPVLIKHQKTALVMIRHDKGKFSVLTGNFIDNSLIPMLSERLNKINELSETELRDLYRDTLNNEQRTAKGTAGLGFIDIARKSQNKLEFEFIEVDEKTGFFCLNVTID
jgi:hypothetical protein